MKNKLPKMNFILTAIFIFSFICESFGSTHDTRHVYNHSCFQHLKKEKSESRADCFRTQTMTSWYSSSF